MNIFNSLGSNYDLSFVLKSLFSLCGNPKDLVKLLEEKYKGEAVLLYKGREAIELALKSLNLPKGSFVAINGFTCFAVCEAVKSAELNVKYLDIDRGELNFSSAILKEKVMKNPKIKAVIVQNTLGFPCQIEEILKVCKKNNLFLIEDLAHSVGTKYESGKEAGKAGDFVAFSFSQDKTIDGISGGALITKKPILSVHLGGVGIKRQIIDLLYPFFTFVIRKTYPIGAGKIFHEILKRLNLLSKPMPNIKGLHKLPPMYAKLVNLQFKDLDNNLSHRREIASIYVKLINPKILSHKITSKINLSSNLRFPIFTENRTDLIKYLKGFGVYISDIWYDTPVSLDCPNSELASELILNLPTHRGVSEKDAENISKLINLWLKSK